MVARARRCFEASAVEDGDVAAAVADQLALLQRLRRLGDADAPHPEHVPEEFMRHAESVRLHAIVRHQQPAREARLHHVKAIARGGLRDLRHQRMGIAVQLPLQRQAEPEFLAEARRGHPQRRPAALHQGANRRLAVPQHERDADHALAADEADFQGEVAVRQRQQRHQGGAGKVDMADRLARFVEHLAEGQRDRLEPREQTLELLARDGG